MFCIEQEAGGGGSSLFCPSLKELMIIGRRMGGLIFFFVQWRAEGGAQMAKIITLEKEKHRYICKKIQNKNS